ncbi:MAG: hypothetical protein ACJA1E_000573 [Paracoccaceae bacterium]|jgi:hypothetical protein
MKPLGDQVTHLQLVQRMAGLTGVDLAAATANGALDQQGWSDIVTRCRGCQWAQKCERWLDQAAMQEQEIAVAPSPCVNRGTLATLRAQK